MTSLDTLITASLLGCVVGISLILFGLLITWLQWRRLGCTLHALGAASLAASAFIAAALQFTVHAAQSAIVGDFAGGVLFIVWTLFAARAAYRTPPLAPDREPRDKRPRDVRWHTAPPQRHLVHHAPAARDDAPATAPLLQ
jgi:hypothetical protein